MTTHSPALIGLVGFQGAGKDTLAALLPDFRRVAFADKVREYLEALDPIVAARAGVGHATAVHLSQVLEEQEGWERAKRRVPEVRRLLQASAHSIRGHVGEDVWVNAVTRQVDALMDQSLDVVVPDVRYWNEDLALRIRDGVVIYLERDPDIPEDVAHRHPSEDLARWYHRATRGELPPPGPFMHVRNHDGMAALGDQAQAIAQYIREGV